MGHAFEIEIKSLLGSSERASALKEALEKARPDLLLAGAHRQRNHYFEAPSNLSALQKALTPYLSEEKSEALERLLSEGRDFSVRTREADDKVIAVVKASIDEGSSANAVSRIEWEAEISTSTLEELDQILLDSGLEYQAKWSREREEYKGKDLSVTIDKNAGYGYLAEFEKVVHDEAETAPAREELLRLMEELGVEELSQDRLERMFAYYNAHWPEYYGTEKTFTID